MTKIQRVTSVLLVCLLCILGWTSPALAAEGNTLPNTGSIFSPVPWTTEKVRAAIDAEDHTDKLLELAGKTLSQRDFEGQKLTTFLVNPDEVGRLTALLAASFPKAMAEQSTDVPTELQNTLGKVFIHAVLPVELQVQPVAKTADGSTELLKVRQEPAVIRSTVEAMDADQAAKYLNTIALGKGEDEQFVHYVLEINPQDIVPLAALLDKYYPNACACAWKVTTGAKVLLDLQVPRLQARK